MTKRDAPFSLRLPPDLRGELEEYAQANGLKVHPLAVQLLRRGLLEVKREQDQ